MSVEQFAERQLELTERIPIDVCVVDDIAAGTPLVISTRSLIAGVRPFVPESRPACRQAAALIAGWLTAIGTACGGGLGDFLDQVDAFVGRDSSRGTAAGRTPTTFHLSILPHHPDRCDGVCLSRAPALNVTASCRECFGQDIGNCWARAETPSVIGDEDILSRRTVVVLAGLRREPLEHETAHFANQAFHAARLCIHPGACGPEGCGRP